MLETIAPSFVYLIQISQLGALDALAYLRVRTPRGILDYLILGLTRRAGRSTFTSSGVDPEKLPRHMISQSQGTGACCAAGDWKREHAGKGTLIQIPRWT